MKTKDLEQIELIERYLQQKLRPEELEAFEAQLESDPDFAEKVESQKLVIDAAKLYEQVHLRELLRKESKKKNNPLRNRNSIYYQIAAIVPPLLIVLVSLYYYLDRPSSTQDTFKKYNTHRTIDIDERDVKSSLETQPTSPVSRYQQGITAYNRKNFDEAIELLQTVPDSIKRLPKYQAVLSRAHLGKEQYAEAIPYLLQLQTTEYFEIAQWHLALAYIGVGEEETAKKELEKIIKENWAPQKEAKKLLKKLNKS